MQKAAAPVCIPTLNRYDHFKRCLESLESCTLAEMTDVYVGLDYPPSEKYVEGWERIDAYLVEKEKNNRFRNFYVRRRDHNCGVGGNTSNAALLRNEVEAVNDYYIFSEDDNEFSPNFLVYMNQALEKYKDDSRIMAICGYNYPVDMSGYPNNIYASHEYSAWGIGRWTAKEQLFSREDIKSLLHSPRAVLKLMKKRPGIIMTLIDMLDKNALWGDTCRVALAYVNDKYTIAPALSMVRNHGHDGSGVHCRSSDSFIDQAIDINNCFELDEIDIKQPNIKGLHDYFKISTYSFIRMLKWLFCYYMKEVNSINK